MSANVMDAWWDATRDHRLLLQRCGSCGRLQHYPRALCTHCGAHDGLGWVDAAGEGSVWSFTTIHRSPQPDVAAPYTVALVRLREGPVMLSALEHDDARCDEAVTLRWRPLPDGRNLPVFGRPSE